MGSVHMETRNEGRGQHEWDYIPLSEPRVVKELQKQRIRVDRAFALKLDSCSLQECSGVTDIAEPILCTYMDQDTLIGKSGMTPDQLQVVNWIMQGYSEMDIADEKGCSRQAVSRQLQDGVQKIVDANNAQWKAYAQRMLTKSEND